MSSEHASPLSRPRPTSLSREERWRRTTDLVAQLAACRDEVQRETLREDIVLLNRGVAEAIASRYCGRGVAREDLEQVAYEGLIKAVVRFEPALGNDLLTYAVPVIRGEVQRYFRDSAWTVRPSRPVQELQWRMNQTIDALERELGREPVEAEIVEALGVDPSTYQEARAAFGCFRPASLDQSTSADGPTTLADRIADGRDDAAALETRLVVAHILRCLPDRDRRMIYLRYFEERTQAEIGKQVGLSQMQVSRRLAGALVTLRHHLGSALDGSPSVA